MRGKLCKLLPWRKTTVGCALFNRPNFSPATGREESTTGHAMKTPGMKPGVQSGDED
jgi:hypothetical protein